MEKNKEYILEQLDKILRHSSFSKSKVNGRLLSYLVHASLNGDEIKEVIIGNEIFGSNYDPIKSDNKVRVYVYNLRKKLDDYYRQNTDKSQIIFSIKKGQYQVQFSESNKNTPFLNKKRKWFIPVIASLLLAFFVIAIIVKQNQVYFWNENLSKTYNTTVLFGDLYTLAGVTVTGENGITRDFSINSEVDFKRYIQNNPHMTDSLSSGMYQYLTRFAPYCSKEISCFFSQNDLDFDVKLLSEWDKTNLQKENVVYFGQSKTMGLLKNVLAESFPYYKFNNASFERTDALSGNIATYTDIVSRGGKITDYTVVAKLTTQNGNSLKFFLSDQDCGAISAIEYFTNRDSTKAFYERNTLESESDFIAIFKVEGWERKGYQMEFVLLDKK